MTELSNSEIIEKVKEHIETLKDDRNLNGICIFVQSTNSKESALYMMGDINKFDIVSAITSFFKNDLSNV